MPQDRTPTSTGRRGWVGVSRHWLASPAIKDRTLRLMLWLDSHTDDYLADLNTTRIATELGWSRQSVRSALHELVSLELISTKQVPHPASGQTRTLVTLHHDRWSGEPVHIPGTEPTGDAVTLVRDDAPPLVRNVPVSTSTNQVRRAADFTVSDMPRFDAKQLEREIQSIRTETPQMRQTRARPDRLKAMLERNPQPPIRVAAAYVLGEDQALIRWQAEQAATVGESSGPRLSRAERDTILTANRAGDRQHP